METQAQYGRQELPSKLYPPCITDAEHYARRLPNTNPVMLERARELENRALRIERLTSELEKLKDIQEVAEHNFKILLLYRYSEEELEAAKRGEVLE